MTRYEMHQRLRERLEETVPVRIVVTKRDIDMGVQDDCDKCPVATAVNRRLNGEWMASAFSKEIRITHKLAEDSGHHVTEDTRVPEKVSEFIADFDHWTIESDLPKPFWFQVDMPKVCLKGAAS